MQARSFHGFGRDFAWRLALVACCVLVGLVACSRTPPEERLRARIAGMQVALETGSVADFLAGIAEDFAGAHDLDRNGVGNLLRAQRLRNARIGATVGPLDITLHGERATVKFTAMLTGGDGSLLPDRAEAWTFTSGWRDGPDDWQLIHASWEPTL